MIGLSDPIFTMKILRGFFLMALISLCFGCASFSKKGFRKELKPLTNKNLNNLNGNYSFYPKQRFGDRYVDNNADSLRCTNSYHRIINENRSVRRKFDSIKNDNSSYSVNLKLIENKKLHISLLENGIKISDTMFEGTLRNKMFYIDNNFLECTGIPYLVGGCNNSKRRIGLSNENHLIINEAINNEGAFLLLIGGGHRYNSSYEFERL